MNNRTTYRSRAIEPALRRALKVFPAVVVTGARQTGKSTLIRHAEPDHRYITLDDVDVREQAVAYPEGLVTQSKQIAIDEVQRAPDILIAVKKAIDKDRHAGRFILTGSANLLLMKRVSESLAGRAAYLTLRPMTRQERDGRALSNSWASFFKERPDSWMEMAHDWTSHRGDWKAEARKGGYPDPALHFQNEEERQTWFAGYTRTYLERDLQDFANVSSLVDFRRLMRAICLRLGTTANQSDIGRDVGLSQATVLRHMNILEASYQLIRVPAYAVNRTKRLIKSPRMYWSDTGLALHLSGESDPRGEHLENIILSELHAWIGAGWSAEVMYWRTTTGQEVDFVVESKGKLLPIEVKATARPTSEDTRHLAAFRDEYKTASLPGLLIHAGDDVRWIAEGVLAVPWWRII